MPRALALDVLDAVLGSRRPFDAAFDRHPRLGALAPRDRAFAYILIATTLRRLGQIDAALETCLERPLPKGARRAHNVLRIGAAQLLFLETPAHAAVDTSVRLASTGPAAPYKKLVNAVLHRLAREGAAAITAQDAARLNTPDWLWQSWEAAYGAATARAIAEAHLAQPDTDLAVPEDAAGWAARLGGRGLPTGAVRLSGSVNVTALEGFATGAWWVQDAGAQLPARLLGDVRGATVVDLCAAPGGKTAQLAQAGAQVVAVDQSPTRVKTLEANLARLRLAAGIVTADARTWRPSTPADMVLLDAPCSATGTIRRHPDSPRTRRPGDVAAAARLQAELLDAALAMVRTGGTVLYVTCSLQPEEGPSVVGAALAAHAAVRRHPIAAAELDGHAELVDADGDLRTLPCHFAAEGGIDGFYAARLVRAG